VAARLTAAAAAAAGLAGAVVFGWWWDHGGQGWLAIHTGSNGHGAEPYYGYWSAFGAVFPWALLTLGGLISGLVLAWRHVNCHTPRCPRVGRYPVAGGAFRCCGRHHPGWDGDHPPPGHITAAHHHWARRQQLP
jgi:hypothetical protein